MLSSQVSTLPAAVPPRLDREESLDRLLHVLIAEAVADMRLVRDAGRSMGGLSLGLLRASFLPFERGRIVGSAVMLLESACLVDIPGGALELAVRITDLEKQAGYLDELLAAAVSGMPWQFHPACLCGQRVGSWRPVFIPPQAIADEIAWRYQRPENHVPLCFRCAARLGWRAEAVRAKIAGALWGPRFLAFTRWHSGVVRNRLPGDWDRTVHPLWPAQFGGSTWRSGCGALGSTEPRPPDASLLKAEQLHHFFPARY